MIKFVYPWKIVGKYEDGCEIVVGGCNDNECMGKLIDLQEKYGNLIWYSGLCDEDYEFGEYIGKDNFIYE